MYLNNDYRAEVKHLIETGYQVRIERYISRGIEIFRMKMDFRDSMETSRKLIHKEWFSIFVFILVLGIGMLFTIPVTWSAMYGTFENIVRMKKYIVI
jgi:hypothetical protein